MEKIPLTLLLAVCGFSSCSLGKTGMDTLLGNYAFQQGRYQKAMVHYLEGLKQNEFPGLIHYNLGNLYFSLGEPETAREAWEMAEPGSDKDLLFRIQFNRGIYYYEKGLFAEAYESYRSALLLKPQDTDAKINLELAYRKTMSTDRGDPALPAPERKDLEDNSLRILQYVQRKEELFWSENQRAAPDTDSANNSSW